MPEKIVLETPVSLLERLRLRPDAGSWQRLVDLYAPLIRGWLARHGLQASDADDLSQEVLRIVVQEMPSFRHDLRTGAFRRWLKNILLNRLRTYWRQRRPATGDHGQLLNQLEDPASDPSRLWDQEHDEHVARRLLELIEPEFEPPSWRAFQMLMLEGKSTADTAAALGLSPNAVRIAKSRVLRRLRQEIEGLVD